jgi:hypothetical protein
MTQLSVTQACVPSNDPRKVGQCLRCSQYARGQDCPDPPVRNGLTAVPGGPVRDAMDDVPDTATGEPTRPRDQALERELTQISALAGGNADDHGLRDFADARAWPGGWRRNLDALRESCEEVADASNYLLAEATRVYAAAQAGDPEAMDDYEWAMRNHSIAVTLWRNLLTRSA